MIQWVACWGFFQILIACLGAPPENYYNAANRLFAARDFRRAELLYQQVLQRPADRHPGFLIRGGASRALKFKAGYNAGNAAYLQGHWTQAVEDYEAALRLDPGDEDAWNNLGLAQAQLKVKAGAPERPGKEIGNNRDRETSGPADVFSLPPAALADYLQSLTRAGYPFRPGSSLKPKAAPDKPSDEVDW